MHFSTCFFSLFKDDQVNVNTQAEPFYYVSLYIPVDLTKSACTNKVWTMTGLNMYSTWSYVRIKATYIDRIAIGGISAISFC